MILAHEIAHIRHLDLRWNVLVILSEILFFFHPFVYLGTRGVLVAQEMAADTTALRLTPSPASCYAEMLVRMASKRAARDACCRWRRGYRNPFAS